MRDIPIQFPEPGSSIYLDNVVGEAIQWRRLPFSAGGDASALLGLPRVTADGAVSVPCTVGDPLVYAFDGITLENPTGSGVPGGAVGVMRVYADPDGVQKIDPPESKITGSNLTTKKEIFSAGGGSINDISDTSEYIPPFDYISKSTKHIYGNGFISGTSQTADYGAQINIKIRKGDPNNGGKYDVNIDTLDAKGSRKIIKEVDKGFSFEVWIKGYVSVDISGKTNSEAVSPPNVIVNYAVRDVEGIPDGIQPNYPRLEWL